MKKSVLFCVLFLMLISFVSAQTVEDSCTFGTGGAYNLIVYDDGGYTYDIGGTCISSIAYSPTFNDPCDTGSGVGYVTVEQIDLGWNLSFITPVGGFTGPCQAYHNLVCGDTVLNSPLEECDDGGNGINTDGCSNDCLSTTDIVDSCNYVVGGSGGFYQELSVWADGSYAFVTPGPYHDDCERKRGSSEFRGSCAPNDVLEFNITPEIGGWHLSSLVVVTGREEECSAYYDINSVPDVILRLSSDSNAHGQLASQMGYDIEINYSDIFGSSYNPIRDTPNDCSQGNTVLKLSSGSNAHAEKKDLTTYTSEVCYGDLFCNYYNTGSCDGPATERCVVTLSSDTNAHLAECDSGNAYQNRICCVSPWAEGLFAYEDDDCKTLDSKSSCLAPANNCTWTPPGSIDNTLGGGRGGCCPYQEAWDGLSCYDQSESFGDNLCFSPFTSNLNIRSTSSGFGLGEANLRFDTRPEGEAQYCAQISTGTNYGFWYDVQTY